MGYVVIMLFCSSQAKEDRRMALLSGNAVYDIFKAHMALPSLSVSGNRVTFDMPSMTCGPYGSGCNGVVKVTVSPGYNCAHIDSYQCKKCSKSWC